MEKTAGHILKGDNVKLEGQFHLDVTRAKTRLPKDKTSAAVTPQAQIVEQQPEFAVIEITCSCGTKTHIRCEYPVTETTEQTK
ncbi:MAG: hypothetical protein ACYSSO_03740 [Planctomycetota bacterium]|jgi:hypothetical protein